MKCVFPLLSAQITALLCVSSALVLDPDSSGLGSECGSRFQCSDGQCLRRAYLCDDFWDCPDGEDEHNCHERPCRGFRCNITGNCISISFFCDGFVDCLDGSDELASCPYKQDRCNLRTEFQCRNSSQTCISKYGLCDGIAQCSDGSDEPSSCNTQCNATAGEWQCPGNHTGFLCIKESRKCDFVPNCPGGTDELPETCPEGRPCRTNLAHQCADGHSCISKWLVCDGNIDCPDGSDEDNSLCGPSPNPELCDNDRIFCLSTNRCLSHKLKCDGAKNCPDGSDEKGCDNCTFRCTADSKCLPQDKVCDGVNDCTDGSDESHKCNECSTNNGGCDHACINSPRGARCQCQKGYALTHNSCHDINECSAYGTCSQTCMNTHGSYSCGCVYGYRRTPFANISGIDCKAVGPTGSVYIAAMDRIVKYELLGLHESIVQSKDVNGAIDIAVDYENHLIYWIEENSLKKASLSNPSSVDLLVSSDISTPEGLTLDWIHRRLYWVDDTKGTVEAVNTDGTDRRVLKSGLSRPQDIVVDPLRKMLYISNWGANPGIYKMSTNGSGFTMFVGNNGGLPNGIAIDLPGNRLYWIDGRNKGIETISLTGRQRTVVKSLPPSSHPFSISVFENFVYWTNFNSTDVQVANRFTGEDVKVLPVGLGAPVGIEVMHISVQTSASNLCKLPTGEHYDYSLFRQRRYVRKTILLIKCLPGYQLVGSESVMCQSDGIWFPSPPLCMATDAAVSGASEDSEPNLGVSIGILSAIIIALVGVIIAIAVILIIRKYRSSNKLLSHSVNYEKHLAESDSTVVLPEPEDNSYQPCD